MKALILILICTVLLGACAPRQPVQPAFRGFGSEGCTAERREMNGQGSNFASSFSRVGATEPGVVGYMRAVLGGERGLLDVLRTLTGTLERENRWIGWTVEAFDALVACHRARAQAVRVDAGAGRLGAAEARRRLEVVRAQLVLDIETYRSYADQIAANTADFAALYNEFAEDNAAEILTVAPYRAGQPSVKPAPPRSAPVKRRATRQGRLVAKAALPQIRPEITRLRGEVLSNVRKRDEAVSRVRAAETILEELDLAAHAGRAYA